MKFQKLKLPRSYRATARIVLCLAIIAIISWLALRNTNHTITTSNILDTPAAIYSKFAEKTKQPLAIQCNSWRLLNQHVYILNTSGDRLVPSNLDSDASNNANNSTHAVFKLELGLLGPRTISIFHPATNKYLQHECTTNALTGSKLTVKLTPVNHLVNKTSRMSASWIPYVSLSKDGSRTYMFAPAVDSTGQHLSNTWLQDNLSSVSNSNMGKFLLREVNATHDLSAPLLRQESARNGDTSNKDYHTRVVCNALEDTAQYHARQRDYMAEYYGYYDRANAESARVRELSKLDDNNKMDSGTVIEGFSSSGMRRGDRGKRIVKALKLNGMLDDVTVKSQELFTDSSNMVTDAPINAQTVGGVDFNAAKANVFDPHTGVQFNDILNHHTKTVSSDITDDRIFDRLERAKMDPSVQNLLDYNEERAKIYQNENQDFEQKLNKHVKENRDATNNLVRRMDQHRIRDMAQKLFFIKNHTSQ